MKGSPIRLDLGAGINPKRGYLAVDLCTPTGIRATLTALPFRDGVAREINCSHVLEHFDANAAPRLLDEIHRVLSDDGIVKILVPDFPKILKYWLEAPDGVRWGWALAAVLGAPGEGMGHRNGFDQRRLAESLSAAGLKSDIHSHWSHGQSCLLAIGVKGPKGKVPRLRLRNKVAMFYMSVRSLLNV